MKTYKLIRTDNRQVMVERISCADAFVSRLVGLLGKSGIDPTEGVWFPRCKSVHMWGMRFPIDIVFCRRIGSVLEIVHIENEARPWQILPFSADGATDVIEIAAGQATRLGLERGVRLCFDS